MNQDMNVMFVSKGSPILGIDLNQDFSARDVTINLILRRMNVLTVINRT